MAGKVGGYRPGAGRPKGSKNKSTIAKEAVAEILDVDDAQMLEAAIHKRGHTLLTEMERIACDPTQYGVFYRIWKDADNPVRGIQDKDSV